MKIKEVIEKTGLTDRAIRLYINEGLAAPSIEESYSGRKSIEFSSEDVERLNNVAMLRKAGFSISDIKSIVDDKDTAKEIVKKFIEQTERNIEHETEIAEKLKSISLDGEVTLEVICKSLSETVGKNEVPSEDMRLTLKEKIKKIASVSAALVILAFSLCVFVMLSIEFWDFRFIKFDAAHIFSLAFYSCWLIVIGECIAIICLNAGRNFHKKSNGETAGLMFSAIVFKVFLSVASLFILLNGRPFFSQTTDPDNYLKLDRALEEQAEADYPYYFLDSAFNVFPKRIPQNAKAYNPESIKYFYEYRSCSECTRGSYDIFAEWVLLPEAFGKAKRDLPGDVVFESGEYIISQLEGVDERAREFLREQMKENSGYNIVQRGDWTFVYFERSVGFHPYTGTQKGEDYKKTSNELGITDWSETDYRILLCAYNDKESKMRYAVSESCYHECGESGPYYTSLDW